MIEGILKDFPEGFTPSSQQVKVINEINQAFDDGYKFVVCCAPTGSGKSFISKTFGNKACPPSDDYKDIINSYQAYKRNQSKEGFQHGNEIDNEPSFGAFALTITKALQDQYKELFPDIDILKGKSNYQCTYDDNFPVDCAPCVHIAKLKDDCWKKNSCPYYIARNKALTSKFSALNYNMFFSLPSHLKHRQYMVCDEAAELEDQLVKEFSCQIDFVLLKKSDVVISPFPATDDYGKVKVWISSLCSAIDTRIEDIKASLNNKKKKSQTALRSIQSILSTLMNLQMKLETLLDTWSDCEYLFERVTNGINLLPLKVNRLSNHLFKYADKIILMSATIIDPENFCKSLGITNFKYIEAESTFDPKMAPIYANTKVKLNYANLQSNLPNIVKQIKEICNIHKNEKGLIHTQTLNITKFVQKNITDKRFIFREFGVRNEEILDIHYTSEDPTVLVSPSMSHGVDLKDDLARFQIIIKAPYLPTTDIRVSKLMKEDFHWYMNKMLCSVIQSCGRGVRSKKDHCVTYILDGAIIDSIIKHKKKIPKYFLDRFV